MIELTPMSVTAMVGILVVIAIIFVVNIRKELK